MTDFDSRRRDMVQRQIASRGVRDRRVLHALLTVPREVFVPERLHEFAYEDTALPIEEEQTISQPYIVALMAEALEAGPDDRVLEVGAGSGYAAAVLSRIVREVYAIERHGVLAELARERMRRLGYTNVHIVYGDGTLGWPEHAPYDAIAVAAGGPDVPPALQSQLAPGGRLVIPIGTDPRLQELVRVRRTGPEEFKRESLGAVRFVPLVGAQGWRTKEGDRELLPFDPAIDPAPPKPPEEVPPPGESPLVEDLPLSRAGGAGGAGGGEGRAERGWDQPPVLTHPRSPGTPAAVARLIREAAEPFGSIDSIDSADLAPLLDRIGGCSVVLLGEATHGTSEFYRMRARARHRRDLPARDRAAEPLLPGRPPVAVRRVLLVRRDPRRGPARGRGGSWHAGHVSFRAVGGSRAARSRLGSKPPSPDVTWHLLDPDALRDEIAQLKAIVDRIWRGMAITQDLGLGMMLWMTHLAPEEDWAPMTTILMLSPLSHHPHEP